MNILVVDQSKIVGDSCVQLLADAGHTASHAHSGHTAIDLLDESEYQICFINPQLTGNNGIELLYEISSYEDFSSIKIVLMADDPAVYERYQHALSGLGVEAIIKRADLSKELLDRTVQDLTA